MQAKTRLDVSDPVIAIYVPRCACVFVSSLYHCLLAIHVTYAFVFTCIFLWAETTAVHLYIIGYGRPLVYIIIILFYFLLLYN